ncbi:MAG: hypothetical protein ACTSPA_13400 [Promethearchaeota archaeon]
MAKAGMISDDGVPGYAAATITPASNIPLAIASFPNIIIFFPGLSWAITGISLN